MLSDIELIPLEVKHKILNYLQPVSPEDPFRWNVIELRKVCRIFRDAVDSMRWDNRWENPLIAQFSPPDHNFEIIPNGLPPPNTTLIFNNINFEPSIHWIVIGSRLTVIGSRIIEIQFKRAVIELELLARILEAVVPFKSLKRLIFDDVKIKSINQSKSKLPVLQSLRELYVNTNTTEENDTLNQIIQHVAPHLKYSGVKMKKKY